MGQGMHGFPVRPIQQDFLHDIDTVIKAAQRQGRKLQIMAMTGPGWDHPFLSTYPEGRYLKVLWAIAL